jgi:hypothetical protein
MPVLAWTVGKNTARGTNSKPQEIDLPIRSTDPSETLGLDEYLVGYPWLETRSPKVNQEESKVNPQEHQN